MSRTYDDLPTGIRVAGRVSAACCVGYVVFLALLVVAAALDDGASSSSGSLSTRDVVSIYAALSLVAASAAAVSAWAGPRTWPAARVLSIGLLALGPATVVLPAAQLLLTGVIDPALL